MEDFKGNSTGSQVSGESSSIKPVTTNVVIKKPGSETSKITRKFFSEDARSVGTHVLDAILIPTAQRLLSDIVKGAIDWLIYGKSGSQPRTGVGTISYGNYYNRSGIVNPNPVSYSQPVMTKPSLYSVQEIVIPDRGDAEEVLLRMREAIDTYGMVSVGDFYDLLGIKAQFTDQKWGWLDLRSAYVDRVDGGFMIRFPKIQAIEK